MTDSSSLIGLDLDGYLIEEPLGTGGMAHVYRALDQRLARYVAIKVIQPETQFDQTYRTRFEREARAVAQLSHPNIVNIFRFGEVGDLYYMAMEYIEGADLAWVLNDYSSDGELMPPEDVLSVYKQVAAALDYAHSRGVIHRDIKPSNIMLSSDARAILTDFGLVLLTSEGTRGEIFGTPKYIAPEQAINSSGAVPQSDQYSLGVMLYQTLTGQVPFDGDSHMEVAMKHISDPLPPMTDFNPDLSFAIMRAVEKALEKEPENRYPSCTAMMHALERAIESPEGGMDTTRISMLHIDDQVREFRAANPLPPIPAAVVEQVEPDPPPPAPAAPVATALPQTEPPQVAPSAYYPARDVPTDPVQRRASGMPTGLWVWIAAVIAILLVLSVLFLVAVFGGDNNVEDPLANEGATLGQLSEADATEPADVTALANATIAQPLDTGEPPTSIAVVVNPTLAEVGAAQVIPTQTIMVQVPTVQVNPTVAISTQAAPAQSVATQSNTSGAGGQTTIAARGWDLLVLAEKDDSLFVINQSVTGMVPFPLTLMQFSKNGDTVLRGNAWRIANLDSGQCVWVAKNDRAKTPDTNCDRVGDMVQLSGNQRFWRDGDNFTITFNNGAWRVICAIDLVRREGCPVFIPTSTAG